jgi:hypothetical protein
MIYDDQVTTEEQLRNELQDPAAPDGTWTKDPWTGLVQSMQEAMENLGPAVEEWGEMTQVRSHACYTAFK